MFKLIRTDGTEETVNEKPTFDKMLSMVNYDTFDVVSIGKANTPPDDEIMLVDDTGLLTRQPINTKATRLYHKITGGEGVIVGDVFITHDRFFGD